MNINYLEEVTDICRRANDQEDMSRTKKEAYEGLASQFAKLISTFEEQSSILRNMIALSDETENYNLCDAMQGLLNSLNLEYELLEEGKRACNYIANS